MLSTLGGIFSGAVAVIYILTSSLATTAAIVLIWLGAGLSIGLLVAWGRR